MRLPRAMWCAKCGEKIEPQQAGHMPNFFILCTPCFTSQPKPEKPAIDVRALADDPDDLAPSLREQQVDWHKQAYDFDMENRRLRSQLRDAKEWFAKLFFADDREDIEAVDIHQQLLDAETEIKRMRQTIHDNAFRLGELENADVGKLLSRIAELEVVLVNAEPAIRARNGKAALIAQAEIERIKAENPALDQ